MKQSKYPELFTNSDIAEVHSKILSGAVVRAGFVSLMLGLAYSFYGLTSLPLIQKFESSVTLWQNTWPRLFFNGLPCIMYFVWTRHSKGALNVKLWYWVISFPITFFIACMIHVWPIINNGNPDLFLYVHSANVFVFTIALVVSAPPPKYFITQAILYMFGLIVAVGYMLTKWDAFVIRDLLIGDNFIACSVSLVVTYLIHNLRLKVTIAEVEQKKRAKPFLGEALADAIYNQNDEIFSERQKRSIILMLDIRNFTKFANSSDENLVKRFLNELHSVVNKVVGENGGYCHKSSGDGFMISFGALESAPDLSDIEGIDNELKIAEARRARDRMERFLKCVFRISLEFEVLKNKYQISDALSLGFGAAEGYVNVGIVGDNKYRSELDVNGTVVIKSARLEQYTKIIRDSVAPTDSVLVLGPEFAEFMEPDDRIFKMWMTMEEARHVRDFPDIQYVFYHVFRNANERRGQIRKLSAA